MIVAHTLAEIDVDPSSIVTVGTFDGVHRGHRAIIEEVAGRARTKNGRSVVITFDPHPKEVLSGTPATLLTTLEERLEEFGRLGVDAALVIKFTKEFSRQSPRDFYVRYLIEGVGAREVIEGHDHTFGRDREAGVTTLMELGREFGVDTTTVRPVLIGGEQVKSTAIREALKSGNIEKANLFLGSPYPLRGSVVRGDGRGAELGFPTINLRPSSGNKLIPANGVYAVSAEWKDERLHGMMNIGHRPTFNDGGERTIEANLFEFERTIYGDAIRVRFHKRLRDEKRFASKEELITQLASDRAASKEILAALE